jgi:hypothetical protein
VPFDAGRCHQLRVSRIAETTSLTRETRHSASDEPCPAHASWPLASAITSGRSRRSWRCSDRMPCDS